MDRATLASSLSLIVAWLYISLFVVIPYYLIDNYHHIHIVNNYKNEHILLMKVLIFKIGIIPAFKLLSLKYAKYIYLYICNISIFVKYL